MSSIGVRKITGYRHTTRHSVAPPRKFRKYYHMYSKIKSWIASI